MIMEKEIQTKIDSYISKLKNNLNKLPEEEQVDVINEIKSHIFESISYSDNSSKKLEEVLKSLGKPKEYANLITQEYMAKLVKKGSFKEQFKMFILNMRTPFSITLFIYLVILQSNTVVLYKDSMDRINLSELIQINLLSFPALIELMIPIGILYSLPWAYYSMAKGYKDKSFVKSWKLWKIVLAIGILSSLSSLLIGEILVPYSNQKTVLVMKDAFTRSSNLKNQVITFEQGKSVQELNFFGAKKMIEEKTYSDDKSKQSDLFYLYVKLAIYTFPLVISLFSVIIGILMTTDLFNNKYLVVVSGILLPLVLYFGITKPSYPINYPVFEALKSNILLMQLTLILLLGVFLRKDKKEEA